MEPPRWNPRPATPQKGRPRRQETPSAPGCQVEGSVRERTGETSLGHQRDKQISAPPCQILEVDGQSLTGSGPCHSRDGLDGSSLPKAAALWQLLGAELGRRAEPRPRGGRRRGAARRLDRLALQPARTAPWWPTPALRVTAGTVWGKDRHLTAVHTTRGKRSQAR